MPNLAKHCVISKQRTGQTFEPLHKWIDAPHKELGVNHRVLRHAYTEEDKQYVFEHFGGNKAIVEWLFHIALDNLETAFKFSQTQYEDKAYNFMQFGIKRDGYVYLDFDNLDEDDLEDEFS